MIYSSDLLRAKTVRKIIKNMKIVKKIKIKIKKKIK